ncbi:ASCH domain-containing protein [Aquipuribacter sp. SD81]|uniref:ASCH domain-containing protein n=1 Tax=Aquipuribacter sp. SD81 TaxID=3127703 RepID=UPI003018EDD7
MSTPGPTRTPLPPHDEAAAAAMWRDYVAAHPEHAWDEPAVEHFGDSVESCDSLLALVLGGGKRATAALLRDFLAHDALPPRIGSHWVACDGRGAPRLVLRSTELRVGPADSVDAAFALDEGEGDRDAAEWLEGHARYWRRQAATEGFEWSPDLPVVFERFDVVWPPEDADEASGPVG